MPGGSKCDELFLHCRVGPLDVISGDQPRDIGERGWVGKLAGQWADAHRAGTSPWRAGLCQRCSPTMASASPGPQVPGAYSYTGPPDCKTGSTIRQASST